MNKIYIGVRKSKEELPIAAHSYYHVLSDEVDRLVSVIKDEKSEDYDVYELTPKLIKEMKCQKSFVVEDTFDKQMKEIVNEDDVIQLK